jgi:hypothetical protein
MSNLVRVIILLFLFIFSPFGISLFAPVRASTAPPSLTVSAGYADDSHNGRGTLLPSPWCGSVAVHIGVCGATNTDCSTNPAIGCETDGGAILITNTAGSPLTIENVNVDLPGRGLNGAGAWRVNPGHIPGTPSNLFNDGIRPVRFSLWGSFTLQKGQSAILDQTIPGNSMYSDFDTSDYQVNAGCTKDQNVGDAPTIDITVDGVTTTFVDSNRILDTGGVDLEFCSSNSTEYQPWTPVSSAPIALSVPITLTNSQSVSTPVPFQDIVTFNPSMYSSNEAPDLGNIRFCSDPACTTWSAWLENCSPSCGTSATTATVWVNLESSIPANKGTLTIYMNFLVTDTNFDSTYWGEAPQLSSSYGQFDNGADVFNLYDDFKGTTLDTSIWNHEGSYTVNNGVSLATSTPGIGCYVNNYENNIYSVATFSSPTIVEAYGELDGPLSSSQGQCILGGVGFSSGRLAGGSAQTTAMTNGWAQSNVNSFGMTIWNNNAYYYPDSPSASQGAYAIFGLGFLSGTNTIAYINGQQSASSSASTASGPLNVVLGFQGNDFIHNNYYWIRARASFPNGAMPSETISPGSTVPEFPTTMLALIMLVALSCSIAFTKMAKIQNRTYRG